MSRSDRREAEVRRMLDADAPALPTDLAARAVRHGERLLRRRRAVRVLLWVVAVCAVLAFVSWAVTVQPWERPAPTIPSVPSR